MWLNCRLMMISDATSPWNVPTMNLRMNISSMAVSDGRRPSCKFAAIWIWLTLVKRIEPTVWIIHTTIEWIPRFSMLDSMGRVGHFVCKRKFASACYFVFSCLRFQACRGAVDAAIWQQIQVLDDGHHLMEYDYWWVFNYASEKNVIIINSIYPFQRLQNGKHSVLLLTRSLQVVSIRGCTRWTVWRFINLRLCYDLEIFVQGAFRLSDDQSLP